MWEQIESSKAPLCVSFLYFWLFCIEKRHIYMKLVENNFIDLHLHSFSIFEKPAYELDRTANVNKGRACKRFMDDK